MDETREGMWDLLHIWNDSDDEAEQAEQQGQPEQPEQAEQPEEPEQPVQPQQSQLLQQSQLRQQSQLLQQLQQLQPITNFTTCNICRCNLAMCQYYFQSNLQWIPWYSGQEIIIEVVDTVEPSYTPITEAEMNEFIGRIEETLRNANISSRRL